MDPNNFRFKMRLEQSVGGRARREAGQFEVYILKRQEFARDWRAVIFSSRSVVQHCEESGRGERKERRKKFKTFKRGGRKTSGGDAECERVRGAGRKYCDVE